MPKSVFTVFKKRKRVFSGVQRYNQDQRVSVSNIDEATNNPNPSQSEPRPSTSSDSNLSQQSKESVSKRKISSNLDEYQQYTGNLDNNDEIYNLINLKTIQSLFDKAAVCTICKKPSLKLSTTKRAGLSVTIGIKCDACGFENSEKNSKFVNNTKKLDINIRMNYAFRCIGKGEEAAKNFCAVMNMPQPTTFKRYSNLLLNAAKDVCKQSMLKAVEECVEENDDVRDITAIFDGSWQRRGHASLNGVVTAIAANVSKVVDVRVLSKYCRCKGKLQNIHDDNCTANYAGTSGGMETAGIVDMFKSSQETYGIRYKYFLGDGDSAAYPTVVAEQPYGTEISIEKLECIGHVQKRMGARLRRLKQKMSQTKLTDGKTIGGRGRLTDAGINEIQKYFGLAIRRNVSSLDQMKQAIWAEYFHLASSNEDPNHGLCPKGPDTWCKYRKAMDNNESYDHKKHFHFPRIVMEEIKPIFKDLSKTELLSKCLHGGTQNACESLNSVIWSRLPKSTFVLKNTLELGIYEAISTYNDGNIVKCKILSSLGITPGINCVQRMKQVDELRILKAEKSIQDIEKKCRQKRSLAKKKLDDFYAEQEDPDNPSYGSGMH